MQNNKANQITSGGRLNPSSSGRSLNEFMRCTKCRCLFAEYFCSRCSSAVYCSVKCQLNDWRHHMDLCIPSLIRVRMPSQQVQQAIEHEPQTRQQGQQAQQHGDQAPEHDDPE